MCLTLATIALPATGQGEFAGSATAAENSDPEADIIRNGLERTESWTPLITTVALETGVPWQVLRAVMIVESGGDPLAHSFASGGVGLMMVVPGVTEDAGAPLRTSLWDPRANLRVAADYLSRAHREWGSWTLAVASYAAEREPGSGLFSRDLTRDSDLARYMDAYHSAASALDFGSASSIVAEDALFYGLEMIGMPYLWAGQSPEQGGFDCSGLVYWAYGQRGVAVPAGTVDQWNATTRIDASEAQPGDLVFFADTFQPGISHVGIWIGGGWMLHSPTEGQFVEAIQIGGTYWEAHLAGFGRVDTTRLVDSE